MHRRRLFADERVANAFKQSSKHRAFQVGNGFEDQLPPALVMKIAQCLMFWPAVEVKVAFLLASLMRTREVPTIAVFLKLRRAVARSQALIAAAEVTLDQQDLVLLRALLKFLEDVEGERNHLAHGCWGVTRFIPDAIVWMKPDFAAHVDIANRLGNYAEQGFQAKIDHDVFFYSADDLDALLDDFHALIKFMDLFVTHLQLVRDGRRSSHLHAALAVYPPTAAALAQEKKRTEKTDCKHRSRGAIKPKAL